jgi:hypothetical protein
VRFSQWIWLMLLLVALLALPFPSAASPDTAPLATQLGDFVWREGRYTANGIQNPGEPGLPYAPVNIYQGTSLIATTNANHLGIYALNVLTPGTYTLEMPIPSYPGVGLRGSPQNAGGNDALDSDVHPINRRATITVGASNDITLDGAVYDNADSIT